MSTTLRLVPAVTYVQDGSSADAIRVVLADDHDAMRRSLRRLLDAENGITVVGEAFDVESATRQVHEHSPHVLILDLHLPDTSPIVTIKEFRRKAPRTQIVVLTMEISPALAEQALNAGTLGYVLKEHADRDLPAAIRCAADEETYITPELGTGLDALRAAAQTRSPVRC